MQGFRILEIGVKNILDSADIHVQLNPMKPITILQCKESGVLTPLSFAIELLCTSKYERLQSLEWMHQHFGSNLSVLIVFQIEGELTDGPSTSQEARAREQQGPQLSIVRAERDFRRNPENVEYTIDNGSPICTLYGVYYKRFFKSATYVVPQLMQLHKNCGGNWLPLLDIESILGVNPRLYLEKSFTPEDFLVNIVKRCLNVAEFANAVRLNYLLKIFNNVRYIFEFITCLEYTIWFYVPKQQTYRDINELTLEDLDFGNIKTRIQLNTADAKANPTQQHFEPEPAIKDMLLLAFHLSLTFNCCQKIIVLRNLSSLRDYLCLRYATAAYVQQSHAGTGVQWPFHNYLQRIIDACTSMKLVAFIEYPGGLPLAPVHSNLVKCMQHPLSGDWQVRVDLTPKDCNIKSFIDALNAGLRQY